MAEIKWIKLSTDLFNNRKIRLIEAMHEGDSMVVIWLKLLILAGEINDGGAVYFTKALPMTDESLATLFGRDPSLVSKCLGVFREFGMIEITDGVIYIVNWERYQNIESMERIREQNRKRVAECRERKKGVTECNVTVTEPCNVTVTDDVTLRNATDKNRTEEIRRDKKEIIEDKPRSRFVPPTLDEVRAYCEERKNSVDPHAFMYHYAANGWKVGRNTMKDWKAAVRTWERNGYANKAEPKPDRLDDLDDIF